MTRISLAALLGASLTFVLTACGGGDGSGGEEGAGGASADGVAVADSAAADSTAADSTAAASADSADAVQAVPVEVQQSRVGDISSYLLFSSTVETEDAVEIFAQRGGMVDEVLAEEGDKVDAGDVLARLTDEEARIEYRESKINLDHLRKNFRRTEDLYGRKLISQQEYENQRFEYEQAGLRYERAELALEYTTIKAPFAGVITERQVQIGSRVNAGAKFYDLIKLDDMITLVYVPGQYLSAIKRNQRAEVTSDFLEGVRLEGWVKRVSPVVDPNSGTFKVTVGIRDRWEELRPGLFVNVEIVTDTHKDAVLVPKEAVVYEGGERFVFVVADSAAAKVKLDAGYEDAASVEALSLVEAGAQVIVIGQNGLKDGAKVRVVNGAEPDAAAETDAAAEADTAAAAAAEQG